MKPKRILSNGILHILLDSESLLQSYKVNPKSLNFLYYRHEKYFDIKRTPAKTEVPEIDDIPTFENMIDMTANSESIRYTKDGTTLLAQITDDLTEIEKIHMMIFNQPTITDENWNRIWNIFVHERLSHNVDSSIYITSDDAILKNRDYFADYPIDKSVNILSIEEGGEVMDFFAKNLGYCLMAPVFRADLYMYYIMAFRLSLPHYNDPAGEELVDEKGVPRKDLPLHHALPTRLIYLLKCMDKMGMGHYHGIDYYTNFDIHFYFNYFIVLVTGIFDSLALYTEEKYEISIGERRKVGNITLKKSTGEKFRKKIKMLNEGLYCHIRTNDEFIDLVYHFRDMIIHRDFPVPTIDHTPAGMGGGLMKVEPCVAACLSRLGDKKSRYDGHSEWGHIKDESGGQILPYIFGKRALQELIDFVDGYLERLGFGDVVVDNTDDAMSRQIQAFREGDLCGRFPRNIRWCSYKLPDPDKFGI